MKSLGGRACCSIHWRAPPEQSENRFLAPSRHVASGPAMATPTTQRAWRALQVYHKKGPVRDASSKGGVEGAYLGPRLPVGCAPTGRGTHHAREGAARSAPESPGVAPALSTMPTASPCRSEQPSLAHLVATLRHGGAIMVMENGDESKQEQNGQGSQHRNARVSLQRPTWCLSRGPKRRRELQNRVLPFEQRPYQTTSGTGLFRSWADRRVRIR